MIQQGIYESSAVVSGGRVYDHILRLVYYYNIAVLINYVQRYIFGSRFIYNGFRYSHLEHIIRFKLIVFALLLSVYKHVSVRKISL